MAEIFTGRKRIRKKFGTIGEVAEMPNLIEVQKSSYDDFLMVKEPVGGRLDEGLQSVFRSVFPISDFAGKATLENVNHALRALHKLAVKEQYTSIALPRLATGVGGLDWDDVEPLIEKHLAALDIPVIVYTTYVAGKAADEPAAEAVTA